MSEVLIIPNVNVVMINVGVHIYLFKVFGCANNNLYDGCGIIACCTYI